MKTVRIRHRQPPAIEAVRFDGTNQHLQQIIDWAPLPPSFASTITDATPWVVRFSNGYVRVYTEEDFRATFDIVQP